VFRRFPLLGILALALTGAGVMPGAVRWNDIQRQPAAWYATAEARAVAASIILYQDPSGGWPKNTDMTVPPSAEFLALKPSARAPTIDNKGTTTQLTYLALVVTATGDPALRAAFERGFDYLLAAQYPGGGWPQFYPLMKGYYSHITYNDNALVNVLSVLREVARAKAPYAFVDEARRARAATAVEKAIDCILRTQVKQEGKLTAWCAQHDETTFAPAPARNFEPVSLSGSESVGLTRFLMGVEQPTPEIIAAVEGAVAWFQAVVIKGLRVENITGADGKRDRRAVADPAAPPVWARFYELGTNKPIYIGRDKVIRYDYNEIEQERRAGYSYLGNWPANLLAKDYPRWRAQNKRP
jgi:PelA/Pel-15E family pectate lyase